MVLIQPMAVFQTRLIQITASHYASGVTQVNQVKHDEGKTHFIQHSNGSGNTWWTKNADQENSKATAS